MRVDKYLKVARVLKRRTISKELASNQRVIINGKIAKPSTEVNIGDEITIIFGNRSLKIRVLNVLTYTKKNEAMDLYEILEDYHIDDDKDNLI